MAALRGTVEVELAKTAQRLSVANTYNYGPAHPVPYTVLSNVGHLDIWVLGTEPTLNIRCLAMACDSALFGGLGRERMAFPAAKFKAQVSFWRPVMWMNAPPRPAIMSSSLLKGNLHFVVLTLYKFQNMNLQCLALCVL